MRKVEATPLSAVFSGVLCAFVVILIGAWERSHAVSRELDELLGTLGGIVFFVVPCMLFVFGRLPQSPRTAWWRMRHPHSREMREHREGAWREWRRIWLRMLCFFLGASATMMLASAFSAGRSP